MLSTEVALAFMWQRRNLRRRPYAPIAPPQYFAVSSTGQHVAELCANPKFTIVPPRKRIDSDRAVAVDDHHGNRLVDLPRKSRFSFTGTLAEIAATPAKSSGFFQRQAVGRVVRHWTSRRRRTRRLFECVPPLPSSSRRLLMKTGVVDLQPLGGKRRATAAIVPGVVEPVRIPRPGIRVCRPVRRIRSWEYRRMPAASPP